MRNLLLGLLFCSLSITAWGWGFLPDRRFPVPAMKPYTSALRIQVNNSIGCGYLVGPDLVLTAGHVASDPDGKPYQGITVEAGVTQGKPTHTASVIDISLAPTIDRDPASGNDWALLRIDRPLGQVYGWLECLELSPNELKTLPVEIVAFSGVEDDVRSELRDFQNAYVGPGVIRDVGANIVFHDCPMWGGSSGSALLAWKDTKPYVVGVVSAGVDVQGEVLERGFRRFYQKELANIAVPSSQFIAAYRKLMADSKVSPFKTIWVRNTHRQPIRIRVRYESTLNPGTQTTEWIRVPSQKRVCVLDVAAGCDRSQVLLCAQNLESRPIGPRPTEEHVVGEEKCWFFRRSLGNSDDYTITLP